jgi:two-component system sensor histidine kinase/response regulator
MLNESGILLAIKKLTGMLIGAVEEFSMEARIFHATCLVSVITIAANIPMNYLVGVPSLALLMTVLLGVVSFIYYYSRIRKKLNSAIFLFCLFSNVFISINYFQNSGINGPSLLIFLFLLFLVIAVAPKIQFRLWALLNIILVGALLFLQYDKPQLAPDTYPDAKDRYVDFAYSYVVIALMIIWITLYIRKSYNKQRLAMTKKNDELEEANETKNKLLSIVAHDLRSPLASIQNYLEMLNEFQLTADEKRSMEQELLEKTKNTGQMLSNLLLWTSNQMEGVSVKLEALAVAETLEPIITIQRAIANEKCIDLKDTMAVEAWIIADANMLQLVIRNLINNAIKFTRPGGEILIASELRGDRWDISVTDTGIGISDERKATIFSIKSQSTYGTRNEKGTGLGLLLCKEFTELQYGEIGFESKDGAGTTFYISMPGSGLAEAVQTADEPNKSKADNFIV